MGLTSDSIDVRLISTTILTSGISGAIAKTIATPFEKANMIAYYRYNEQLPLPTILLSKLWKSSFILRYSFYQSALFTTKEILQRSVGHSMEKDGFWKWLAYNFGVGGASGAIFAGITYPNETVAYYSKQNMQSLGIYKGFTITCIGAVIHRAVYFGLYDSQKERDNFVYSFLLAFPVSICARFASYPADMVRSRLLMDKEQLTILQMSTRILEREGLRPFVPREAFIFSCFRSLSPALVLSLYDRLQLLALNKN